MRSIPANACSYEATLLCGMAGRCKHTTQRHTSRTRETGLGGHPWAQCQVRFSGQTLAAKALPEEARPAGLACAKVGARRQAPAVPAHGIGDRQNAVLAASAVQDSRGLRAQQKQ